MTTFAARFLSQLSPGTPFEAPGILLIPLVRSGDPAQQYISMSRAFAGHTISVGEVSEGGSVPNLSVVNSGNTPVLLLDGEEVAGAKQNRILNTSILVDAVSTLVVPVSCTESGRWGYSAPGFSDSGYVAPRSVRVPKTQSVFDSLRTMSAHRSDQGEVWDRVAAVHLSMGTSSDTGALRDAMEQRRESLDAVVANLSPVERQVGFVAVCSDGFIGMDAVSRPEVYADLHSKLVRSYLADLMASGDQTPVRMNGQIDSFLDAVRSAKTETFDSPGLGHDERLASTSVGGTSLVHSDEVIHLGAFSLSADSAGSVPLSAGRIARRHWRG